MVFFLGKKPIKRWKVISQHEVDDNGEPIEWTVELWGDGKLYCNCYAASYRRKCHHVREKTEELIKEFSSIEEALTFYKQNK